jgi:hypothetical protein
MTGKTFSTIKTNVGNMICDTSNDTDTLIGVWVNDAYQDAWRRAYWADLIDDDFTFESVADQAEYSFSSDLGITDFGKELFVADIANGHMLDRFKIKDWWKNRATDYSDDSLDSGNPLRYVILPEAGSIKLDPPPDTAETYAMPYQKEVSDLSDDSDTPSIVTISTYLEFYATGQGFAYKKQYEKASWWLNRAEAELRKLIKQEYVKINQTYQRKLANYRISKIERFMGNRSYDTI